MAASALAAALAAALALAPPPALGGSEGHVPSAMSLRTATNWSEGHVPSDMPPRLAARALPGLAPAPEPVPATSSPPTAPESTPDLGPFEPSPAQLEPPIAPEQPPEAAAPPPPEPAPKASSAARPEGPDRAPAVDLGCHGSAQCQRLIVLGSVAGGLGLAALAAGTALLVRTPVVDPDDPTTLVTYRPAGAALLAIGSGLAATWLLTLLAARKASRIAQRRRVTAAAP